jgi:uncharacterized protein (TIGR00255 family)
MIRSMTGFGRAEVTGETFTVTVEARSVNHRYLDVTLRLPGRLADAESEARRLVQARVERGRVDVAVQVEPVAGHRTSDVRVDTGLARRYLDAARALGAELGLEPDVNLGWVLGRPGVITADETPVSDVETPWPLVRDALGRALDDLAARREAEGAVLATELRALGAELAALVPQMAERAPVTAARRAERLRERMRALAGETGGVDEARIVAEVAVWATKSDVTEELARLRAHLQEFGRKLDKDGPVGRALDFLIQEMHREVNTVGAKADDLELSQAVLAAKGVLEKIREQVQNLE